MPNFTNFIEANDDTGRDYLNVAPKEQAIKLWISQAKRLLFDAALESVYAFIDHPRGKPIRL